MSFGYNFGLLTPLAEFRDNTTSTQSTSVAKRSHRLQP